MSFKQRSIVLIMSLLVALAAGGCNSAQKNQNRQGATATPPKPGKWIAQYRSPASFNYAGTNLALFFYSGISVVSKDVVFVCGDTPNPKAGEERNGVIVRTTDGGQSWTDIPVDFPGVLIPTLNAIHFINPEVGWAVGSDSGQDGIVIKTTNGGASWTLTRLTQKQTPVSVFFVDAGTGWIGGSTPLPGDEDSMGGPSAMLATTDGGNTWRPQYNIPHSILNIRFIDQQIGWASGTRGVIYHTTDGGRSWDKQRTEIEMGDGPVDLRGDGVKQFAIGGLQFIDKDHGFAAAAATEEQAGRMLVTSNGGATWHRQWMVNGVGVRDVFFVNPDEGWALTDQGGYINRTVDGGRSWFSEPRIFEQDVALAKLAGADGDHVWAVGGGAIFFRVKD